MQVSLPSARCPRPLLTIKVSRRVVSRKQETQSSEGTAKRLCLPVGVGVMASEEVAVVGGREKGGEGQRKGEWGG